MESTQQHDVAEQGRPGGSTSSRGFASMNQERQREIARKGGRAAHAKGTAHEFTSDEAPGGRPEGRPAGQLETRAHVQDRPIGGKKSAGRRQEIRQGKATGRTAPPAA
jgi:general stress protein YciG